MIFLVPYLFFVVFADKYFTLYPHKYSCVRKIPYALSFFISFRNTTREDVCLTFGHLVLLCGRQARARQSNAVARLIKWFLHFCLPAFFYLKDYICYW